MVESARGWGAAAGGLGWGGREGEYGSAESSEGSESKNVQLRGCMICPTDAGAGAFPHSRCPSAPHTRVLPVTRASSGRENAVATRRFRSSIPNGGRCMRDRDRLVQVSDETATLVLSGTVSLSDVSSI